MRSEFEDISRSTEHRPKDIKERKDRMQRSEPIPFWNFPEMAIWIKKTTVNTIAFKLSFLPPFLEKKF